MRRVAAIDCGTNSVRLLITDFAADGSSPVEVLRTMRVVRLGAGVDRTGVLDPAALDRTGRALTEYSAAIAAYDVSPANIRMIATSATRDAANTADFTAMVRQSLGLEPEVVSGVEEATLSFRGSVSGLSSLVVSTPVVVTDIGGGSSELVRGLPDISSGLQAHSMDVGAVRLTERHLHSDPPTLDELAAARADVAAALELARPDVDLTGSPRLVGVAGSVTTVAALVLRLTAYDRSAIHGAVLSRAQVRATTEWLCAAPRAEREASPVIHPGRVDVIAAGAVILGEIMDAVAADELTVSESDILDGIAASI